LTYFFLIALVKFSLSLFFERLTSFSYFYAVFREHFRNIYFNIPLVCFQQVYFSFYIPSKLNNVSLVTAIF